MTKIIDPTGITVSAPQRGPRRTVTDITGTKITTGYKDTLPPEDPLSLELDSSPNDSSSSSEPQTSKLPPNPEIFKVHPPKAHVTPVTGMSGIVEAVRRPGGLESPYVTPPSENTRRLSHNEMLEEVVGSRDLSNQTKFYLIAKMGIREDEEKAYQRASTEDSEMVSESPQPRRKNSPQKGN